MAIDIEKILTVIPEKYFSDNYESIGLHRTFEYDINNFSNPPNYPKTLTDYAKFVPDEAEAVVGFSQFFFTHGGTLYWFGSGTVIIPKKQS